MARQLYRVPSRPVMEALRRLYDSGIRLPELRVGELRLALHPQSGRLFVRLGERRLGTILTSGIFRPVENIHELGVAAVQVMLDDPLSVIRTVSNAMPKPKCAVCRIPLGHDIDRDRGIGDKCWKKGEFWRLEKRASSAGQKSSKIEASRKVRRNKTK
jgi:hypothetical protein